MVKSMVLKLFLWLGLLTSSEVFSFIGHEVFERRHKSQYLDVCNMLCIKMFILTLSKMGDGYVIEEQDFLHSELTFEDYNLRATELLERFIQENSIDTRRAKELKAKINYLNKNKVFHFLFSYLRELIPMPRLIDGVPWQKYFIIKASRRFIGELKAIHPKFVVLTALDLVPFA